MQDENSVMSGELRPEEFCEFRRGGLGANWSRREDLGFGRM